MMIDMVDEMNNNPEQNEIKIDDDDLFENFDLMKYNQHMMITQAIV